MKKPLPANKKNSDWPDRLIKSVEAGWDLLGWMVRELRDSFRQRTIPAHRLGIISLLMAVLIFTGLDYRLFQRMEIESVYPFRPFFYWAWVTFCVVFLPYFGWAYTRVSQLKKMLKALTAIFRDNNLVTMTGKIPGYVSDKAIDSGLRELRLTMNGLPKRSFESVRDELGTALHGFVEEITENRTSGELVIKYARCNFPDHSILEDPRKYPANSFVVGDTRTDRLVISLRDVPHILIGGFTTSGKSTFIRQMVTTLYFCNPLMKFIFLDFKGRVEGNDFERLERVEVHGEITEALSVLDDAAQLITLRLELLHKNKVKNIDELLKKKTSEIKWTDGIYNSGDIQRIVLVIDEATQVFLASTTVSAEQATQARRNAITISAQGRAVGIHLIVATQRPDVKAIDGMIKANLVGRLCFAMADNASSMTILDSVRAADLPPAIKRRAVWRDGSQLIEVQVPLLESKKLDEWLSPLRLPEREVSKPAKRVEEAKKGITAQSNTIQEASREGFKSPEKIPSHTDGGFNQA